jgi:hypothetical protein
MLMLALGSVITLVALCAASAGGVWSMRGRELVLPGATDVQIDRSGIFRVEMTYHFPTGRTLHDLTQHLRRLGWRRVRFPNAERETFSFVRPGLAGRMREIVVLTVDPDDRKLAKLQFSRCVTIGAWFRCM